MCWSLRTSPICLIGRCNRLLLPSLVPLKSEAITSIIRYIHLMGQREDGPNRSHCVMGYFPSQVSCHRHSTHFPGKAPSNTDDLFGSCPVLVSKRMMMIFKSSFR